MADLGLTRYVDLGAQGRTLAAGSLGYAAPEQWRGDPSIDARADVFAASAIMVAALTGEQPHPVTDGPPFDDETLDQTGPLRAELARGLSSDRSHRHPDLTTWFSAITANAAAESIDSSTTETTLVAPIAAPIAEPGTTTESRPQPIADADPEEVQHPGVGCRSRT